MKPELRTALAEKGRCDLPGVLLAAAECAPLAKTGGLADVVGTLPKSLAALGFDARIITPYHRVIKDKYAAQVTHLTDFYIDLGWRHQYVGIERLLLDGIVIYLVDNEFYFGDRIYLGGEAEGEQYAFFARAILEALPRLDFTPEVLHCNDWHTAVLPMLMKTQYAGRMQSRMQTLLTIHNIAYQGKFSFEFVQDLLGIDARYYTPEFMELNGCANLLKAGCVFADHINTVSPSYAGEIRTAAYGEGLEGILNARQHQLSGILNGIDTAVFDPAHDSGITAPYSMDDMSGKAVCRAALCQELGLEIGEHTPIVAMVTRMTPQKGFDLVQCVLDELMEEQDMAFVLLGTGNAEYEDFMRSAEWRHKGRLCAYIGYDEALSHRVYAGSDFLLMPSSFEPCGLSQMIAMRYGAVPIVRSTGGLADTVRSCQVGTACSRITALPVREPGSRLQTSTPMSSPTPFAARSRSITTSTMPTSACSGRPWRRISASRARRRIMRTCICSCCRRTPRRSTTRVMRRSAVRSVRWRPARPCASPSRTRSRSCSMPPLSSTVMRTATPSPWCRRLRALPRP